MDDIASLITQQGEIARRRRLLEASQGQNMQTPIQGSGWGIGQALAKVATAYMLGKQGKELAGEEQANRQGYTDALQGGLNDYLTTRDGSGPTVLPAIPGDANQNPTVLSPVTKANPREAIVRAMASQMPELQAIGKADFAGLTKQQINPLDLLKLEGYDPKSKVVAALSNDPSKLTGKREIKDANGQIFTIGDDGTPKLAVDARDKFGPAQTVNGEAVQFAEGTNKAHQIATRPPQTNILPPSQKVGLEELFRKYGGSVADMAKTAQESLRLQGALAQLGTLDANGTYSGPAANAAVWVNSLANAAGIPIDQKKLANSENYNSVAAEAAQRLIGQFGGNRGVTKEEAEQIKTITPQLATSPAARAQLSVILSNSAKRSIDTFKAAQSNFVKAVQTQDPSQLDPLLYGSQVPTETPQTPAVGSGQPIPLDEYLRRQNAGR